MPAPLTLPQLMEELLSEGSRLVAPPDIDPNKTNILGEKILNELEDALAKDDTPRLHVVPRSANVTWTMLLGALVRESYKRISAKQSKIPKKATNGGITAATRGADAARKQLVQAIDGNKSNPRRSAMLRERIFAAREIVNTKAGWEAELRSEIAAIKALGDEAPPAVVDMLEILNAALTTLDARKSAPTGRAAKTTVWSPAVIEAAMAINLAIGELISSAASKATPKRNASLVRLATPKKRAEEKPDAPAEKKTATQDAPEPEAEAPPATSELSPEPSADSAPQPESPAPPGPIANGADAPVQPAPELTACDSELLAPPDAPIAPSTPSA